MESLGRPRVYFNKGGVEGSTKLGDRAAFRIAGASTGASLGPKNSRIVSWQLGRAQILASAIFHHRSTWSQIGLGTFQIFLFIFLYHFLR